MKEPASRPRNALILTGGGFSGALFEIGGLVAFDEVLGSVQPSNGFDIYVGASAGSVVGTLLSLGLPARELWQMVLGESTMLPAIRPQDVFRTESPYRSSAPLSAISCERYVVSEGEECPSIRPRSW